MDDILPQSHQFLHITASVCISVYRGGSYLILITILTPTFSTLLKLHPGRSFFHFSNLSKPRGEATRKAAAGCWPFFDLQRLRCWSRSMMMILWLSSWICAHYCQCWYYRRKVQYYSAKTSQNNPLRRLKSSMWTFSTYVNFNCIFVISSTLTYMGHKQVIRGGNIRGG